MTNSILLYLIVGMAASAVAASGSIVINEMELNPPQGGADWVELFNSGNQSVDISGWTATITDGGWIGKMSVPKGTTSRQTVSTLQMATRNGTTTTAGMLRSIRTRGRRWTRPPTGWITSTTTSPGAVIRTGTIQTPTATGDSAMPPRADPTWWDDSQDSRKI